MQRFFLDSDQSGHWYLVPEREREAWNAWRNLDEDDERSWDAPDFAERLNRHPSAITFEAPLIR